MTNELTTSNISPLAELSQIDHTKCSRAACDIYARNVATAGSGFNEITSIYQIILGCVKLLEKNCGPVERFREALVLMFEAIAHRMQIIIVHAQREDHERSGNDSPIP